ncbi:cell wall-associated NlpC family hydrolase [Halopolyspora algeriensis]|uniref:Cell wall-associated NlpC family hydrolase n=1 Tax=Halopolyspora algeriensis TaxID=1500506 RepID=A0A368VXF6_9ACTN|nr:NlpC/P60 family protein [Halopolyspora algeriensis]RCW45997.1 cell wall-associated NlpC family hydrolase [Halopolyspora algeriensis]TQM55410.1 cell wall-associated NlpC family hydrolase [Halopolyspora algeriensis]
MTRSRDSGHFGQYGRLRCLSVLLAATVVGLVLPAGSAAVPPRPPNPGEERIDAERARARAMAERVGALANRLAATDSRLRKLSARVERRMEEANKARVDLRRAEQAYRRAKQDAEFAAAEADAAQRRVDEQRHRLDEFAANSYQQGSRLGSIPAFVGAESPREMLDRAALLDAVSDSQLDVLGALRRARTQQANKDSLARQAVREAESKRAAADRARAAAEKAKDAAVSARQGQQEQARRLRAEKARVEQRLEQARAEVAGLEQQRDRYREWLAAKRREERAAAAVAQSGAGTTEQQTSPGAAPEDSSAVETVVQRAVSQVGVPYAWGGGNAHGPTRGIRDGGVADAHGDYRKIGFDCSGLMVYAFAGVGIELPHYSGYQYQSGRKVPVSQRQRGDMLFWRDGGGIHHVALYLGQGRMVEAPYSGAHVRVTSVRYDGLAPYAVRLL